MTLKWKHLYAGLTIINSILKNRFIGCRVPLLAHILVTNRCNLRCVYCFSNANKTKDLDIPLDRLYSVVDQLKNSGTKLITITGGEPCLRKDIGNIIDYILKKGIMVELVTNGINFQKNLDYMKKLDFLAISIDGNEEVHDLNRGRGAFRTALRALELAKESGIHTRIHACFSKKAPQALPELMEITKRFNVRVNIAIPSIHTNDSLLAFNDDEIRDYYRQMKEYKKKGYSILNSYSTLDYISKWPKDFGYVAKKRDMSLPYLPCKRKDFCIYIDSDGSAYPCASVWGKYNFNVFRKGVQAAFREFEKIDCTNCILESEFNLLFNGNPSSIINVAAFGLYDRLREIFK